MEMKYRTIQRIWGCLLIYLELIFGLSGHDFEALEERAWVERV